MAERSATAGSRMLMRCGVCLATQVYLLFDDLMFLSEGRIVFHGPREEVCLNFEHLHLLQQNTMASTMLISV